MNNIIIKTQNIVKNFESGNDTVRVLGGVDFELSKGEIVAVEGPSGSGKTTFLHIIGALERPTSGDVFLSGKDLRHQNDRDLSRMRNKTVGFVFQFHNLFSELSALENVMIPMLVSGIQKAKARDRAREILSNVGLSGRLSHHPSQLSGGEKQRVAIARAVANSPKVVLADEPTGNLDLNTARTVLDMFLNLARNDACGVVIVTHNTVVSSACDRTLRLKGGVLV
ncbi:ABC transporter ATP-binding protein [candidate division WOR-3 bacterium]|nr:ABC transporter ATP-binding protein [candidate division WOR-3 bacterium]